MSRRRNRNDWEGSKRREGRGGDQGYAVLKLLILIASSLGFQAALNFFIKGCARKYGPEGIRFNTVAPGRLSRSDRDYFFCDSITDLLPLSKSNRKRLF